MAHRTTVDGNLMENPNAGYARISPKGVAPVGHRASSDWLAIKVLCIPPMSGRFVPRGAF